MLGYAEEHETTVLELTYNYGVTEYTKGNAYAQVRLATCELSFFWSFFLNALAFQVAIGTDDVYKSGEVINHAIQEHGGKITRKPGPIPGINTKIVSFLDPDGWKTVSCKNTESEHFFPFYFLIQIITMWLLLLAGSGW